MFLMVVIGMLFPHSNLLQFTAFLWLQKKLK